MQLPFSVEQFFEVLGRYNETVWPAQWWLNVLALAAIGLVFSHRRWSGAAICAILAFLWSWLGIAFHLTFFTRINPLGYAFGAVSVLGALVFTWYGVVRRQIVFRAARNGRTATGVLLVVFALFIYPLWPTAAGQAYPDLPTFGLPCPTTIFTIGLLALATGPGLRVALLVPVLWSLVGGQAAILLDVPPDMGLFAAGLIGIGLAVRRSAEIPVPSVDRSEATRDVQNR